MRIAQIPTLVIHCDGSRRYVDRNVGVVTYAWLVSTPRRPNAYGENGVACRGPVSCSIMAEYAAIVAALRWLCHLGLPCPTQVEICSDCEAVVRRLTGATPPLRRRGTVMLHRTALRLAMWLRSRGHQVRFCQVPRQQVHAAHMLCRQAHSTKAASHPKALTRFLRSDKPSSIRRRNEFHAKLFTKVGRPPDSELNANRTK